MRILKLRFKNIHSLAGEHTIDFTKSPLYDTGIFAIIGPTGSGKTTILDVITLALYGKISRFGNKLTNNAITDDGAVVTRGQQEAFAEVSYEVDGVVYQSLWKFRRKKDMILFINGEAVEDKEVDKRNEEIIGLSYEQFIRAVVLPQGEFANFLKADSDDKIQILEKITGGMIFRELGSLAFLISNEKKQKVEQKKTEIDAIDLLTQDQEEEIKSYIQDNISQAEKIKQNLEVLEKKRQLKQDIKILQEEIKGYQKKLEQVKAEYNQWKKEFDVLDKHEKFSQYKDKIKEYSLKKAELGRLKEEIEQLKTEILLHKKRLDELTNVLDKKQVDLKAIEADIQHYQPIVEQVRELDTEIKKLDTLISEKLKRIAELDENMEQKRNKLNEIEKERILAQTQLENIKKWLDDNKVLENLRTEIKSIEQGFSQYGEVYNRLKQDVSQTEFEKKIQSLPLLQKELEIFVSQLAQEIEKINKEIEGFDSSQLKELRKELKQQVEVLKELIPLRGKLEEFNSELDTIVHTLTSYTEKEKDLIKQKNNFEKQLADLQLQRRQVEDLLEQEREKVIFQQARENLEEGKPCPVCGAVHHPYVVEGIKIYAEDYKKQLNEIEQKTAETEEFLKHINNELSRIDGIKQEALKRQQDLSKKIEKLTKQILEKLKIFEISEILDSKELQNLLDAKDKELHDIERKLEDFTQYSLKQKDLRFYQGLEKDVKNLLSQKQELKERIDVYANYYPQGAGVNTILKALKKAVQDYEKNEKRKIELEKKLAEFETNKHQLSVNIEELVKDRQLEKQELTESKNNLNKIKKERFNLLEDKDVNKFWDALVKKHQTLVRDIGKIKEDLGKHQVSMEEKNKQVSDKEKHSKDISSVLEAMEENLLPILQKLDDNVRNIEQAWDYILKDDKVTEIKRKKEELNEKILQLDSSIKEKQQKLKELQNNDDSSVSFEQVVNRIKEYSAERDKLNQLIGQLKQKLQENEKKKSNYQRLMQELEQLEQDYFRWRRLEELIGNSDGSKFQRIAQEYSFVVLLQAANSYLTKFTDRYRLEYVKETKRKLRYDLYVVDNYMNGQKRDVATLSGGESFLVSLSLALGLSALASQRIRIQNIFIDEGFGSLDAETLDQALAVLERFQSESRRKIGIISHVEALKERIPVKIQLVRVAKGFSSISVVST